MKKILIVLAGLFLTSVALFAQEAEESVWKKGGSASINFSQVSFSNWAAGGVNTVSGVSNLQLFAKYKKDNTTWDNQLEFGYGLTKQKEKPLQKNDDLIDLESKLGIKASEVWYYSALLSFKSQFAPGYSDAENLNLISNLLAPAYTTLAVGMDYKPSDKFSAVLSPLTGKATTVIDENLRADYGVDVDGSTRFELGAYINASTKFELAENVTFSSTLGLFSNYLDNPQNIDVDWKVELDMKINSYLNAKINSHYIYDDNVKTLNDAGNKVAQGQFKQMLGVGLAVKF